MKKSHSEIEFANLVSSFIMLQIQNADRSKFQHAAQLVLYDITQDMRLIDSRKALRVIEDLLNHLQSFAADQTLDPMSFDDYVEMKYKQGYMQ